MRVCRHLQRLGLLRPVMLSAQCEPPVFFIVWIRVGGDEPVRLRVNEY